MKIFFTDFWAGFDPCDNFIYNALIKHYSLEIDQESPDILFFSCYGSMHMQYQCIKVYYTGENDTPNFTWCDYAMGFDDSLSFGDRYLRLPLYAIQPRFIELFGIIRYEDYLSERKFCNYVYSNDRADPIRNLFFHQLNNYKRVDSGGQIENNIGDPVKDKLSFISDYKFTIAFENSVYPGYTTEKIVEPMISRSIPIYYGNPNVNLDFNPESFVWVKNADDIERAIQEIIFLDQNKEAYMSRLSAQKVLNDRYFSLDKLLCEFLGHIFEDPLGLSVRRPSYGFSRSFYNQFVRGEISIEPLNKNRSRNKVFSFLNKRIKRIVKR